jgi:hypothetical protein
MASNNDDFARFEHDRWQLAAESKEMACSALSNPFIPHLVM